MGHGGRFAEGKETGLFAGIRTGNHRESGGRYFGAGNHTFTGAAEVWGNGVTGKIYIIDDGEYATMLWADEY